MTDEEIDSVDVGVQLLPMTAGAIVLSYNLPNGPKELKLSREAYTKIFLGRDHQMERPGHYQTNPGATLPDTVSRWCVALTAVGRPLCSPST